jgi:hypothetical protein
MYHSSFRACAVAIGLLWQGAIGLAQTAGFPNGPIRLDPICQMPEARNPVLAAGNPAPSTRRMAKLLAGFRATSEPEAMAFLSDKMVLRLQKQIAGETNLPKRLKLQYQLGFQQINAGRPDDMVAKESSTQGEPTVPVIEPFSPF